MTLTDEQIAEIRARAEAATPGPWRLYGVALKKPDVDFLDHARDDIPALLSALEAANKRADETEARRKCYECGSEMTACARCNPELPTAKLTALRAQVAELEDLIKCSHRRLLSYASAAREGSAKLRLGEVRDTYLVFAGAAESMAEELCAFLKGVSHEQG